MRLFPLRMWLCCLLLAAAGRTPAAEPDPFPEADLEDRIERVNEGQLRFLREPPPRPVHHHHNRITISEQSIGGGWVTLEQCHYHLDPVAAVEIVYHPQRIRGIHVLSSKGVDSSRVLGPSVQLSGVKRGASLCLQAESRALQTLGEGHYRLRNGPYMRRFLDGYYPMRVSLEVRYPPHRLSLIGFHPAPGASGQVLQETGRVVWEGWFEGRLYTDFDFRER